MSEKRSSILLRQICFKKKKANWTSYDNITKKSTDNLVQTAGPRVSASRSARAAGHGPHARTRRVKSGQALIRWSVVLGSASAANKHALSHRHGGSRAAGTRGGPWWSVSGHRAWLTIDTPCTQSLVTKLQNLRQTDGCIMLKIQVGYLKLPFSNHDDTCQDYFERLRYIFVYATLTDQE